jgi:type II secretory pathway predicted ATPase ExeA
MCDGLDEPLVLFRGLSKRQKQGMFDSHASLELDSRYKLIKKFQQEKEFLDEVLTKENSSENPEIQELRLAITGTSGTGKTTLLLKIGFWILEHTEDVPIWISLKNVGTKTLKEYLLKDWLSSLELLDTVLHERKQQLNQLLQSGRVWLLLDGAEDLTGTSIPLREIVEQLTPWADKAQVVLTCRKSIWNAEHYILDAFNFDVYQTLGYSSDRVNSFIDAWFSEEPELSKQLQDELKRQSRRRIKDLVQNPLHLALLCRIWQDSPEAKLPKTRVELYKQFIYEDYKRKKENFSREQLIKALGELARYALNKKQLKHSLVFQKLDEHQLKVALRLGWLKVVDAKNEVYDFVHESFKEYFAAEFIENGDDFLPSQHDNHNPQPVRADYHLFERHWQELILLWLGRDEEELEPKQLSFWESLLSFEDGCNGFYSFQVFLLSSAIVAELGDEELVDYFVEHLVNFSFSDFVKPIAEGARLALQEFDYNKLNSALLQLLATISYDENYLELCSILMQSAPNEATRALAELLENTQNMQNMSLLRIEADGLLRKLDPNHPSLIAGQGDFPVHTLTNEQFFAFESVLSDPTLWETEECDDISTLIELLEVNQNPFLSGFVIKKLEEIVSSDPTAINTLCELTYKSNNENIHEVVTCVFGETAFGREDAVKVLIHLLRSSQSRNICQEASESLKQILQNGLFKLAVSELKDCLTDAQSRQINFERYVACYEVVWYCAQHMTYPDFYKAWYP